MLWNLSFFGPDLKRMGIILLVSAGVAVFVNTVSPRKIPWVQAWSNHIEAQAYTQQIPVLPLSTALEFHHSGIALFVDVRSTDEYAAGHISEAISLPFQRLDAHVDTLVELASSNRPLVVYCSNRKCDDALMLAIELRNIGAQDLWLFVDGFEIWQQYGGAVAP